MKFQLWNEVNQSRFGNYLPHSVARKPQQTAIGTSYSWQRLSKKSNWILENNSIIKFKPLFEFYLMPTTFLKSTSSVRTMYLWKSNFGACGQCSRKEKTRVNGIWNKIDAHNLVHRNDANLTLMNPSRSAV